MSQRQRQTVTLRSLIDPLSQDGAGGGLRVGPLGAVHYDGIESSSDSDGAGDSPSAGAGGGVSGGADGSGGQPGGGGGVSAAGGSIGRTASYRRRKASSRAGDGSGLAGGSASAFGGTSGGGGGSADASGAGGGLAGVLERTRGLLVAADGTVLPSSLNPTRPLSTLHNSARLDFSAVPYKRPNTIRSSSSNQRGGGMGASRDEAALRFAPPALTNATSVGFESEDVIVLFGGSVAVNGSSAAASPGAGRGGGGLPSDVSSSSSTAPARAVNDTWIYSVLDTQWSRVDSMAVVPEALAHARRARGFAGDGGALPPPRCGHCAVGIREVQLGVTAEGTAAAASSGVTTASAIGGSATAFSGTSTSMTLAGISGISNGNRSTTVAGNGGGLRSKKDLFLPNRTDALGASVLFGPQPAQEVLLAGRSDASHNYSSTSTFNTTTHNNNTFNNNNSTAFHQLTTTTTNGGGRASPFSPTHHSRASPAAGSSAAAANARDPDPWAYRPSMVVFGGADLTTGAYYNDLWVFDVQCRAWREVRPAGVAPSPRWRATAAACEQRVFVFGGETASYAVVNDLHMYDHLSCLWRPLRVTEPCPRPRMGHAATVVGDKMIILGGVGRADYAARAAAMGAAGGGKLSSSSPTAAKAVASAAAVTGSRSPQTQQAMGGGAQSPSNGDAATPAASDAASFSFSPAKATPAPHDAAAASSSSLSAPHRTSLPPAVAAPISDVWCLDMRTLLWRELGILDKRNSVFALHSEEARERGGGGGVGADPSGSSPSYASGGGSGVRSGRESVSIRGGLTPITAAESLQAGGGGGGGGASASSSSPFGFRSGGGGGHRNSFPARGGLLGGQGRTLHGAPNVVGYGSLEGHVALGFNQHIIVHGGLLGGRYNQRVFSFDTANEVWQYHGEISTTGGFSAGDGTPATPIHAAGKGGGRSSSSAAAAATSAPDGPPMTKPQPRAFHCGAAFVHRTCPNSLTQFSAVGQLRDGRLHLSELKETEPLLDFFVVTRAQQIAEAGVLTVYKNRPVTSRTVCVFFFGGQSFPRNMSDLWMLRLTDNSSAALRESGGGARTMGALAPSRTSANANANASASAVDESLSGGGAVGIAGGASGGPSGTAGVPLLATGVARANIVPIGGAAAGLDEATAGARALLASTRKGGGDAASLGSTVASLTSTRRAGTPLRSPRSGSDQLRFTSRQALADVLYAASKGGVLPTDPTAVLPRLLGGSGASAAASAGGAGGAQQQQNGAAAGGGPSAAGAAYPSGGAATGATAGGVGGVSGVTISNGIGGATSGGPSASASVAYLRDLRRQAARRDEGTFARSQRSGHAEGYFPSIEALAAMGEAEAESEANLLISLGSNNASFAAASPPHGGGGGETATVAANRRVARPQLSQAVYEGAALHSSDGEGEGDDEDDDDDRTDDEEEEEEEAQAERRRRIDARKHRLVEQLRAEIVSAAHQYILGGHKAAVRKQQSGAGGGRQ